MSASLSQRVFRTAAVASLASSVVSAVCLFVALKVTLDAAGAAAVGVWALVQGIMVISRIMDGGGTTNVVKRVSLAVRDGRSSEIAAILLSGLALTVGPTALLGSVLWFPTFSFVTSQAGVPLSTFDVATLVTLSVVNGIVAVVAMTLLSVLEGAGHQVSRYAAVTAGSLALLLSSVLLATKFGVLGFMYAYIAMNGVQLVLAGALIARRRLVLGLPVRAQVGRVIASMYREALGLSTMSLLRLSFEPLTKLLISLAAPLATVAHFDIALRLTTQVRVFFQAMTQPLVMMGAREGTQLHAGQQSLFASTYDEVIQLALRAAASQLLAVPLIGLFFLGTHQDATFNLTMALLVIANAVNSFGMVGYFVMLSGPGIRGLLGVHIIMLVVNVAVGGVGWYLQSYLLIVAGYALAFAIGGGFGVWYWKLAGGDIRRAVRQPSNWLWVAVCWIAAGLTMLLQAEGQHLLVIAVSVALTVAVTAAGLMRLRHTFVRFGSGAGA